MIIIKNHDEQALIEQSAELISSKIEELTEKKSEISIGLVGGRSVSKIYEVLSHKKISWNKVHFFLADERNTSLDDIESNFNLIKKHLLSVLLEKKEITEAQIHQINTSLEPEIARKKYEQELEKYGNKFDIAILSSGEDNHVAGIFPSLTYPDDQDFCFFDNSPKPPSERFSVTPSFLSRTENCFVLFTGQAKKHALKHFTDENTEKTTAEETLLKIKNLIILTDQ